jgi:hypothetical protein
MSVAVEVLYDTMNISIVFSSKTSRARSVSRVTAALSISSVSQPFPFLVGCSGMILKGLGFVAFFAGIVFYPIILCFKYIGVYTL